MKPGTVPLRMRIAQYLAGAKLAELVKGKKEEGWADREADAIMAIIQDDFDKIQIVADSMVKTVDASEAARQQAEGRVRELEGELKQCRKEKTELVLKAYPAMDDRDAMLRLLMRWLIAAPAFRSKPVGAPHSQARLDQDMHIELEDETRKVVVRVNNASAMIAAAPSPREP